MIAEYERAQTRERSRRGKRFKARQGSPSVLSGAPYGYRYVKRRDGMEARYEILAREEAVVRQVTVCPVMWEGAGAQSPAPSTLAPANQLQIQALCPKLSWENRRIESPYKTFNVCWDNPLKQKKRNPMIKRYQCSPITTSKRNRRRYCQYLLRRASFNPHICLGPI